MSAALQLVEKPDTTDLQAEGSALVIRAKAIAIIDDETFTAAVAFMNDCSGRRKVIIEKFREPKQKAHEAHQAIRALELELLTVVDEAEREAKRHIGTYRTEQERRAAEERRRLEEDARKREEDRLLAEAQDAQDSGDDAAAEEILSEPIAPPPVHVAPPTPKAAVTFRETWSAKVTDLGALVRFVAANPQYSNLLTPNMTALNSLARTMKSAGKGKIGGVDFITDTNVASSSRR